MASSNVIFRIPMCWAAALAVLVALVFSVGGCDDTNKDPDHETVKIGDRSYVLEVVATPEKRVKGLSGRTSVPEGTGMLFVFTDKQAQVLEFVMRDCVIPIDIIFLDRSGRVTATHAMKVEEARRSTEPKPTNPRLEDPYEARLKRYSSRYVAQFAIELAEGELQKLSLKEGDKIALDLDGLKKRAK